MQFVIAAKTAIGPVLEKHLADPPAHNVGICALVKTDLG